ncbi:hypothetical protein BH09ACT6_BH09ACT6_15580 [soil metagenome]
MIIAVTEAVVGDSEEMDIESSRADNRRGR